MFQGQTKNIQTHAVSLALKRQMTQMRELIGSQIWSRNALALMPAINAPHYRKCRYYGIFWRATPAVVTNRRTGRRTEHLYDNNSVDGTVR